MKNTSQYQRQLAALGKRLKKVFDDMPGLQRLDGPIKQIEGVIDYLEAKRSNQVHREKTEAERREAMAKAREEMLENARNGDGLEAEGSSLVVEDGDQLPADDASAEADEQDEAPTSMKIGGKDVEMGTGGVSIPDSVGNPMMENSE